MSLSPRSWLYVSGVRAEHFTKALDSPADAVIFDLEDSVAGEGKAAAREHVVDFLHEHASSRTFVRTNPVRSDLGRQDLTAIAGLPIGGVRLPKVEGAADVHAAVELLANPRLAVQATIESARGVRAIDEIAAADGVQQICLGEADLVADLSMTSRDWLQPIRIDVVVASRAAGLRGPLQGPYSEVRDLEGLAETTRTARSMGFAGRSAVHPTQVDVINSAYLPTADEVAEAQAILRALADGEGDGRAGVLLPGGRFIDVASAAAARRIIAASRRDHQPTKGGPHE